MAGKISILLVDDHAVVRAGYKTYLSLADKIGQIYEADRGETDCQMYSQQQPDIVVLDLSMLGIGGFESIRRLINRDPHCKILVFSIHNELVYVTRALKAGANNSFCPHKKLRIKSCFFITCVCAYSDHRKFYACSGGAAGNALFLSALCLIPEKQQEIGSCCVTQETSIHTMP